ncbi:ion transporter [Alphaproteobacteria bacterium]|jgi:voltage-gated potassium channel|nr:ion transporter [Pseudomonadota bacterium]MDC1020177.1 ion transporter [Alphaproteobacteria bacterium]NBR38762.1 ion transporter [Alphaproteobacteria bacterium]
MISKQRMLQILERGSKDDSTSRMVDRLLGLLIILNVMAICLESVGHFGTAYEAQFWAFELFSVFIFGTEYILRIWASGANEASGYRSPTLRRLRYIFSFTGIIDLLAILPSLLPLFMGEMDLRWLRALRLVRLFKISHYSSALEDLVSAIRSEIGSFGAALYLFLIALFMSSAMMYLLENEAQPEKFSSIPQTMWWSLITLTTVGYGDVSPVTPMGQVIGAITALMGVCVVALLTGIVASAFSNQMSQRKLMLEAEIASALSDGVLSDDEIVKIEKMRREFHLSEQHVDALMKILKEHERT